MEDRRQILQMLAEGKINADEAERLLAALERPAERAGSMAETSSPVRQPKYLRVMVDAPDKHQGGGPVKVNIRVPMRLLRAGVRLGSFMPVQARDQVNEALHKQGIAYDINQMKPEDIEAMIDELNDLTVDVDGDETKVRVFCE